MCIGVCCKNIKVTLFYINYFKKTFLTFFILPIDIS